MGLSSYVGATASGQGMSGLLLNPFLFPCVVQPFCTYAPHDVGLWLTFFLLVSAVSASTIIVYSDDVVIQDADGICVLPRRFLLHLASVLSALLPSTLP